MTTRTKSSRGAWKPRVAVLDDEARMLEVVEMVLSSTCEVQTFQQPQAFLETLLEARFDILITDLRMPGTSGLEVLEAARQRDPHLQVILMTAHASIPTAVRAMRQGAFDYIEKPFANDQLRALVQRAAEVSHLRRENRYLRSAVAAQHRTPGIVAESPAMQRVLRLVHKVAHSRSTVLVTGDSGTGKEVVARLLHFESPRVDGPFVAVNTKAIADSLVESELFGHAKGAFTGAHQAHAGLFERAHGGTLFLDEIGETSGDFQAKLLRVLEERQVRPVGSSRVIDVDVRVVAATNRDLDAEVAEGRFREDLFFRLNVVPVHLPPLRERPQDILPLARHFLARLADETGPQGHPNAAPRLDFTSEAEDLLLAHPWPGNARELENAVERGALLADGPEVDAADLLLTGPSSHKAPPSSDASLKAVMDEAAASHIRRVLEAAGGSRSAAAQRLGVERTTLYRMMRRLGIE